ncbi:sulfotransferase [Halomonas huangheensis]|uniref:Sulfotransferase n=1 Tax=Halomonas huangheensis TaxID=1178482 RepID=W1NB17_9GAMM|nr:sulfotransferase [Halomonas huangheensis]ALM53721.1 hypothetical protein AR456_16645 [Halomonas huangheensis]ERL52366.1 hypothetical protein BJB45_10390 [Halomonas huangheensis]
MESDILKHSGRRTVHFRPNDNLAALIKELQAYLSPAQEKVNLSFKSPEKPIIGVIGCPRSGTTFLTQLLISSGAVSYPSNLMSRFAYAPYMGALIQQLLLNPDYDLGSEFSDLRSSSDFSSNVGKTTGALGISEFFHFWRRFTPNHDPGHIDESNLDRVDIEGMRKELASIEAVFGKPLMSKAMMLQYNIDFFAENFPEIKFIYIKRDPLYLMQSIKQARIKYYGDESVWWSVKPKEYDFLKDASPDHQVAGQVLFTHQAIMNKARNLSPDRFMAVDYEEVCAKPKQFLHQLSEQFEMPEFSENISQVEDAYTSGNSKRLPQADLDNLMACYDGLKLKYL